MIDIRKYIVSLSTIDAQLKAALGATPPTDPRIYWYYQPAAIVDAQHPAYITYALTASPEQTQATGDPVWNLAIWGLNAQAVDTVRSRLVVLLEEIPLTTGTGRQMWGTLVGERDSFQENTKFSGLTLQYEFGFSRV